MYFSRAKVAKLGNKDLRKDIHSIKKNVQLSKVRILYRGN